MCINRWRESEPQNAQVYCLEGQLHLDHLRDESLAEASFRRAVELDPDHEGAHLGLGLAVLAGKRFSEAAEHFEFLRQRQPDNWNVQVSLAECWAGLGQETQAVGLLEDVLAQQPQEAHALALLGRLLTERGEYAEAESRLRQAIALSPSDQTARHNLIMCLQSSGKDKEAQEQQRQFKQMQEDFKRFDEIVRKDLASRPNDPSLHFTLGKLLLRGGYREDGLRWLRSALRLDPNYAPAREALKEFSKNPTSEQQEVSK